MKTCDDTAETMMKLSKKSLNLSYIKIDTTNLCLLATGLYGINSCVHKSSICYFLLTDIIVFY